MSDAGIGPHNAAAPFAGNIKLAPASGAGARRKASRFTADSRGCDLPIKLALQGVHHGADRAGVGDPRHASVLVRQLDELTAAAHVGLAAGDELFLSSHCRFPFRCRFLFAVRPDRALADAAQDGR